MPPECQGRAVPRSGAPALMLSQQDQRRLPAVDFQAPEEDPDLLHHEQLQQRGEGQGQPVPASSGPCPSQCPEEAPEAVAAADGGGRKHRDEGVSEPEKQHRQGQRQRRLHWQEDEQLKAEGAQEPREQTLQAKRKAPLQKKLTDEVHRRLRRAVQASLTQNELLRQLLADICQRIDVRAHGLLAAEAATPLADKAQGAMAGPRVCQCVGEGKVALLAEAITPLHDQQERKAQCQRPSLFHLAVEEDDAEGSCSNEVVQGHCEGATEKVLEGAVRGDAQRSSHGDDDSDVVKTQARSLAPAVSVESCAHVCGGAAGPGKVALSTSAVALASLGPAPSSLPALERWQSYPNFEVASLVQASAAAGAIVDAGTGVRKPPVWFYQLLAEHYGQAEGEGDVAALLPLFSSLWSSEFTSQVFALLLHQWVYLSPESRTEAMLRYTRASLNGADALFWIDLGSNERRFLPLFDFLMREVLLTTSQFARVPPLFQADMVRLVARFVFLYHPGPAILELMHSEGLQDVLLGSPSHLIVTEITNQLQRIKVQEILLQFLRATQQLRGVELPVTTNIRLQVVLHSLTATGGPLFPTAPVRRSARCTLDCLFPVGKRFRYLISLFFRLLHPLFWPASLLSYGLATVYKLLGYVRKAIDKVADPGSARKGYYRSRYQHLHTH